MVQLASHSSPPNTAEWKLIGTMLLRYEPIDDGIRSRMKTVGPTTNTNSTRTPASTMLVLLSHLMPLETPLAAEKTTPTVSTQMTMIAAAVFGSSANRPVRSSEMPAAICRAPSPRDVADPNLVQMIARMSIGLPQPLPSMRSLPNSDWNGALIRLPRPIRNVE